MVPVLLLFFLLLTACDESFVAFEENDLAFSMYGYLDPSHETQWLRVTPIRTSIETFPGPVDAVVTIEEIETGRTITMASSAYSYLPIEAGGSTLYAHNFSTAESILPGNSYRVTATGSEGGSSTTTVSIPSEGPEGISVVVRKRQNVGNTPFPPRYSQRSLDRLQIFGVEHIAIVETVQDIPTNCSSPVRDWREWQQPLQSGASLEGELYYQLAWRPPLPGIPNPRPGFLGSPPCALPEDDPYAHYGPMSVTVIASGTPWPFEPGEDLRETSHINSINTVTNGFGFIGGTLSRTFPYEPELCTLIGPGEYCDIVFDSESVTLEGSVIESCDSEPLSNVAVSLREVAGTRIRPATTDSTGYFRIRGLEPETTYRLALTRTRFISHETDLEFSVAENRTLPTIELEWEFAFDPCQFR